MKHIEIKTIEELKSYDFSNLEIVEDTHIDIKLRLEDVEFEYPINIYHKKTDCESKLSIKIAIFGKSKIKIPVGIYVEKGAFNTATDFKATVYLMSPQASANVTPGLMIHEKNIRSASHGVVIKNIKERDLTYIRARGIEKRHARDLLIGF